MSMGVIETKTTIAMTYSICFSMPGILLPRKYPMRSIPVIQNIAPVTLNIAKRRYFISATPATTGANVRANGMNCARTIVIGPYFS